MKIGFRIFLWYSRSLGYDVTITKEKENSYELYSNTKVSHFDPQEKIEIPIDGKPVPPPTQIIREGENPIIENRFYKFRNAKISYLDLKQVEKSGGIAVLISKKVNEIINIINLNKFPEQ